MGPIDNSCDLPLTLARIVDGKQHGVEPFNSLLLQNSTGFSSSAIRKKILIIVKLKYDTSCDLVMNIPLKMTKHFPIDKSLLVTSGEKSYQ